MTAPRAVREITESVEPPRLAHIVPPDPVSGRSGADLVSEARVHSFPVLTLCRITLTPSRDPARFQTCAECLRLYEGHTGRSDGFVDA